jgi:hypothetical protein
VLLGLPMGVIATTVGRSELQPDRQWCRPSCTLQSTRKVGWIWSKIPHTDMLETSRPNGLPRSSARAGTHSAHTRMSNVIQFVSQRSAGVGDRPRSGLGCLRSRRARVRREQEGRHGDEGGGEASGVPLGGACAFEHGDLATGAATTAATY